MSDLISIGKIINFFGIQGEAKVGYSNADRIKNVKDVIIKNKPYNIEKIRFHKNYAIVKFQEIDSINDLLEIKGENVYIEKQKVQKQLEKDEYLIGDLVGLTVFDDKDDAIGIVESIATNTGNDILSIKPQEGKNILIPFVKELVPIVDIKNKKIIIKPIKGLLPWD